MKKVLIISPHFPPVNAADMHRVRQSLPFFRKYGWEPTVLAVDEQFVEMARDENLAKTIPADIRIIKVKAFSTSWTRKAGLGNLGIRSFFFLWSEGKRLLKEEPFDLVYFSTTVFAAIPAGYLWKKKFGVPFLVDFQDPWRNDYYLTRPRKERPGKFWFDHALHKRLEAFTMPHAGGVLAVSPVYIEVLRKRYPVLNRVPSLTLTFGASAIDFEVLDTLTLSNNYFTKGENINIVYIGVTPPGMAYTIRSIFRSVRDNQGSDERFARMRFFFLGTSYAPRGLARETVMPLALESGLADAVFEEPVRLPYFETLKIIRDADFAIIPGSSDTGYTASKLYPYILARINLLAIFHEQSGVSKIIGELSAGDCLTFRDETEEALSVRITAKLKEMLQRLPEPPETNWEKFDVYTAEFKTREQVRLFEQVIQPLKQEG